MFCSVSDVLYCNRSTTTDVLYFHHEPQLMPEIDLDISLVSSPVIYNVKSFGIYKLINLLVYLRSKKFVICTNAVLYSPAINESLF